MTRPMKRQEGEEEQEKNGGNRGKGGRIGEEMRR